MRFDKLTTKFQQALADAQSMALGNDNGFIEPAHLLSAQRPLANIVAFSRHETILNRLGLLWGVRPLYGAWVQGVAGVVEQTERELLEHKLASAGDNVAITFGMVMGNEALQTNVLKLYKMRGK